MTTTTDTQALLFAGNALNKLFTQFWTSIPEQPKKDTRKYLLNFLYQRGSALLSAAPATLDVLVRLLARIVKLSWLDAPENQDIVSEVSPFLKASTAEWVVGVLIYLELTQDMAPRLGLSLARDRRAAFLYRDTVLPQIFQTAISTLQQFVASGGSLSLTNADEDARLLNTVLKLTNACLSFDFMATFPDESIDDRPEPIMIPSSWSVAKQISIPQLLLEVYKLSLPKELKSGGAGAGAGGATGPGGASDSAATNNAGTAGAPSLFPSAAASAAAASNETKLDSARLCLQCAAQVTAFRRSFFGKEDDRTKHITSLVTFTAVIITERLGIFLDSQCYHHFCRLLAKINQSISLGDLKQAMTAAPESFLLGSSSDGTTGSRDGASGSTGGGGSSGASGGSGGMGGGSGGSGGRSYLGYRNSAGPYFEFGATTRVNDMDWNPRRDRALLSWLELIFNFTTSSLQQWTQNSNSKHYIVQFWTALVNPITMNNRPPATVVTWLKSCCQSFIDASLCMNELSGLIAALDSLPPDWLTPAATQALLFDPSSVSREGADELEDPLSNELLREEQLAVIETLSRVDAAAAASHVSSLWQRTLSLLSASAGGAHSQQLLSAQLVSPQLPLSIIQRRLTWLVYIVSAVLAGQTVSPNMLRPRRPEGGAFCGSGGGSLSDTEGSTAPGTATGTASASMNGGTEVDEGVLASDNVEKALDVLAQQVLTFMTGGVPQLNPMELQSTENDSGDGPDAVELLELSFLAFCESLRKLKFSDSSTTMRFGAGRLPIGTYQQRSQGSASTSSSSISPQEGAATGLEHEVFTLMVQKILFNLKTKTRYPTVLTKSLAIFNTLTSAVYLSDYQLVISGRYLIKLPVIQALLSPRQGGYVEILDSLDPLKVPRIRTSFCCILTKLVLLTVSSNNDAAANAARQQSSSNNASASAAGQPPARPPDIVAFADFMQPMAARIAKAQQQISTAISSGNAELLAAAAADAELRRTLVSVFRDLRGVCEACVTPDTYSLFCSWLVNRPKQWETSRLHLLSMALEVGWMDHSVSIAALRFGAELTTPKAQRISFDPSSPLGIILFREVAHILNAYAPKILARQHFTDTYREKYKGLAVALRIFTNTLAGSFANLGAFEAYGDQLLPAAIRLGLKMVLAVPENEIQAYLKSLKPIYQYIDLIAKSHIQYLIELDFPDLETIIRILEDGLCSYNTQVSLQACTALAHIAKHLILRLNFLRNPNVIAGDKEDHPTSEEDVATWQLEGQRISLFIEQCSGSISRILNLAFQLVMSGQSHSTWILASTMLAFIILAPQEFQRIQQVTIQRQLDPEKQQAMATSFANLMDNVDLNLSTQSKDRFLRQLLMFSNQFRDKSKGFAS